ncbi:MAG TPA: RNA-binding protein, partial [Candidatus Marinimicrobia bacterium]|nr:RNA-binding protein [Candidatus Neomarinimicrobiota bacterium]
EIQLEIGSRTNQSNPSPITIDKLDEIVQHIPSVPIPNYAFHNQGDLTFNNRADEWGLGDPGFSSGAVYADFNNDGGMDLVVNNTNSRAFIYKNLLYRDNQDSIIVNKYLKVQLIGKDLNTFGVGSKVLIYAHEKTFFQELMPTRGFQSSVEPVLNFGLGNINVIDSLMVIWPTGEYQVLSNIMVNQKIKLNQTDASGRYVYRSMIDTAAIFQDITEQIQIDYKHQENTFIEFNREPFIPHFLSMEGPAFDVADVNDDGLIDLYLGGGKHQSGSIYLQNNQGDFTAIIDSAFILDSRSEGVDAVFFNANNDAFPDLYVAKGGNEYFAKMEPIKDCLYFGKGNGLFMKTNTALPDIYANSACVKPVDIDNDGDIDLFVGSRSVPREYGSIPKSYLLINNGTGKFTDGTSTYAPALSEAGMVTDAIWIDLNNDNFQDLVLVGEWMPIKIFYNHGGILTDVTDKYGLQNTTGWWNTIAAGDFNEDGFIDLVVGNLGLNSFLKASKEKPIQLFINDFAGNNKTEQILTYY